jgi:hypothetical protein
MSLLSPGDLALINDTLNELANATLTAVETPGTLARNGDPGEPVPVWTGEARGFLERQSKDILSQGVEVSEATTTFILFDEEGRDETVAVGSILAGADWGASTVVIADERLTPPDVRRFTIVALEHQADGTLDHILLTLNADVAVA